MFLFAKVISENKFDSKKKKNEPNIQGKYKFRAIIGDNFVHILQATRQLCRIREGDRWGERERERERCKFNPIMQGINNTQKVEIRNREILCYQNLI